MSWLQIYLHGRGSNLSEYCRRYCLSYPIWVALESSFPISQRSFIVSITLLSTSILCFLSEPIGNDSTRHADNQKVSIRWSFPGEALKVIRLSNIKSAKHYFMTSTLDLVHGVRSQVPAVYIAKHEPPSCLLFGSLQ